MSGGWTLRKIAKDEPFVFLSVLFIILKVAAHFVPTVVSHLRAFLVVRVRSLNLGIHRGSSQLMKRALTVLDVRRLWSRPDRLSVCYLVCHFDVSAMADQSTLQLSDGWFLALTRSGISVEDRQCWAFSLMVVDVA